MKLQIINRAEVKHDKNRRLFQTQPGSRQDLALLRPDRAVYTGSCGQVQRLSLLYGRPDATAEPHPGS